MCRTRDTAEVAVTKNMDHQKYLRGPKMSINVDYYLGISTENISEFVIKLDFHRKNVGLEKFCLLNIYSNAQ